VSDQQLNLDWAPGHRPPRARRDSPLSSHAAADRLEKSGRDVTQSEAILAIVHSHPGLTAKQIDLILLDTTRWIRAAGRRLPELEGKGLIEGNRDGGPDEIRWHPVLGTA